jgi:3-(3-hydroxy-phenyl)propionate hydroxylase
MERAGAANKSVDVAIVGYGPVGATAANFLGKAGLKVAVIERDPSPYPRARAISTDEEVLRTWQQIGLADELVADMLGGLPIDFVDARGKSFLDLHPQTRGNGYLPQYFIYQPALEATIRRGVDQYPNVEILLECEAGAVTQDEDQVQVSFKDLTDGSTGTVSAQYLLACDGGSSPVRTQLGIGFDGKSYEDRWLVIDTKVIQEWPEVNRLRFHCDPERPAVDCPTPLGHHRWEFPVSSDEKEEELEQEGKVWQLLARHGITSENVKILRTAVYTHHVRFASNWKEGRVLLLGDAAHVMPPWIGQGMASGVRDVGNLGWKLAAVIKGQADESLLDSYEPERQPSVRSTTKTAVFFGGVITERRRVKAILRNLAFAVAKRTPVLGRYLRNGDWLPQTQIKAGFVDRSSDLKCVGESTPQPWVRTVDGKFRLDDVLGQEWSVISTVGSLDDAASGWTAIGARWFQITPDDPTAPGQIADLDGTLVEWMNAKGVGQMVLRPDHFVYAAAGSGGRLPAPPEVLKPTRKEVPA